MEKEYLYVGYYIDTDGNFILKIGTTNDLDRRRYEHNHNYRKATAHTMPKENSFTYIWTHKLSKYNTLRYEDRNRELWQEMEIGEFIRNDRFVLCKMPKFVPIKIRKTYQIELPLGGSFCTFYTNLRRSLTGVATGIRHFAQIQQFFLVKFCAIFHLAISRNVWYNNSVKRGETKAEIRLFSGHSKKKIEKLFKNLLTNTSTCGII